MGINFTQNQIGDLKVTKEELSKTIQKAAIDKGISGVMELVEITGLSYARTVKAWKGDKSITLTDLAVVCETLDLDIALLVRG